MIDFSTFKTHSTNEYFQPTLPLSSDYKVFIGDKEVPVYTCRISKDPYNSFWPGHQRVATQSDLVSYVNIVSDEDVTLRVVPTKTKYDRILIKPYSKNVVPTKTPKNEIIFTLKSHGGYTLNLDDFHDCLYIFNSSIIPSPDKDSVTYYFDKGIHFIHKLELKSNESIYVDKDAMVFGNIYSENSENIKVFGNGIFDAGLEERPLRKCLGITIGNARFINCNNVKIQGVGFTNSAVWCVNVFACKNVEINDIKVFGQWKYNTDGIDLLNSSKVNIKNSFIQSFDDGIVIKGYDEYSDKNNENITAENCVVECQWGRALEIGLETSCREYNNILFKNIDIIRPACVACDIQNGDCAEVHNVTFDDIRIELDSFYNKEALQSDQSLPYPNKDTIQHSTLLMIINKSFRESYKVDGTPKYKLNKGDERFTSSHDITFKNIKVYADDKVLKEYDKDLISINLINLIETTKYYNINIENINLNGKKVPIENINVHRNGTGTIENVNVK